MNGPSPESYAPTQRLIHWLTAAMLAGLAALGVWMTGLPQSDRKIEIYDWHKWAGLTVWALTLLRLALRQIIPAPAPLTGPAHERLAAAGAHAMLYLLLLSMPITGWAMTNAFGFPVTAFGVITLPTLLAQDNALGRTLANVHLLQALALGGVVAVHAGAAIFHRLVRRDGVLARMLPGV